MVDPNELKSTELENIFKQNKLLGSTGATGFGETDKFGATLIVATDDSGQFNSIQEAIDDLPPEGGKIVIKNGTYTETFTINKSNVTIEGSGAGTIISQSGGATAITIPDGISRIQIKNLRITGGANGIRFVTNNENCLVTECFFETLTGSGVGFLFWASTLTSFVTNCIFKSCGTSGEAVIQANITGKVVISENLFDDCGICIDSDINDSLISNNIFSAIRGGKNCMTISGDRNIISNNTITDGVIGIAIENGAEENIIDGNTLRSQSQDGILGLNCDRNIISNNVITDGGNGIRIGEIAGTAVDNIITGNVFENNSTDISDGGTTTHYDINVGDARHSGFKLTGDIDGSTNSKDISCENLTADTKVTIGTTEIEEVVAGDTLKIGGEAEIGVLPALAGFAMFGHSALNHAVASNYAVLQQQNGQTFINSAAGLPLSFRIANVDGIVLDSSRNTTLSGNLIVNGTSKLNGAVDIQATGFHFDVYSDEAVGANRGGHMRMGGKYVGSSVTEFAEIAGLKENSVSGEFGGYMNLRTRTHGAGLSTRVKITSTGDFIFEGDGVGLPFGAMYGNNIEWTSVAFGGGGTFVIIDTLTGGEVNNTTFQNTQELLIATEGRYLINWSLSAEVAVANKHIEIGIGVNGTANVAGRQHIELPSANKEEGVSGTAILDLAATNTISLMITNLDDNTQVEVHHVNLTLTHIGGT